jgi:hypothetical protein
MMADLEKKQAERIALVVVPSRPNEKIPIRLSPRFGWTGKMTGSFQRPAWSNCPRKSASKSENGLRNEPKSAALTSVCHCKMRDFGKFLEF